MARIPAFPMRLLRKSSVLRLLTCGDAASASAPVFARHRIRARNVIRCLEEDPGVRVLRGRWFEWFEDGELRAALEALPAERFVGAGGG